MTALTISPTATETPQPPRRNRQPMGRRVMRAVRRLPVWILVALLLIVVLYPQLWMVLGSFKTQAEFLSNPTWALPEALNFDNYIQAFTRGNVAVNYWNSLLVTIPSVAAIVLLGVAAGYALEVMIWKGRHGVLLFILAGIMVPGQMILVPLFTVYFRANLTDTLWPLIITYVVMGIPLTTFLMAAYFRAVPREMFEAATVDGSGPLRSFFIIGLPMMKNAILTVGLVQFFSVWNDLLIALTFTTRSELATIQVGLLSLSDEYGSTQYGPLFAAISINIIVLLIVFVFLNKKIMAGLAAGSVKG
ncbi:carbohydrate ABC transporter permease [Agromyces atrinae]|uniref:Carbohydrate ABC transporter permease n=1 Tax=Agromyces atrinae TaxID=592376 RepID=A0A4Q2M7N0_9MICO|nr:carbohydrate ABC transporter permease [Agromyces atrinae]MCI2957114.1 carbohydrate ABC transporter permease [Agromyces atrinae]NYD67519.1 raffinose/stachyose/melibiose transport system permease protein [Agromyces atrinae]RXZ88264.1 carbohydrate ABC transporter permease [Agromyces atrinae]